MVVSNVLRNPAKDRFNGEPKQLEKYWNMETAAADDWEFLEILYWTCNILPIKLVFLFLGDGSVSQHESIRCMFSALFKIFMCPANWLLFGSVYAENMCNFHLKLISVCVSMEGSAERRDLQSERTNDRLSYHRFCAWDRQMLGRRGNLHVCSECI